RHPAREQPHPGDHHEQLPGQRPPPLPLGPLLKASPPRRDRPSPHRGQKHRNHHHGQHDMERLHVPVNQEVEDRAEPDPPRDRVHRPSPRPPAPPPPTGALSVRESPRPARSRTPPTVSTPATSRTAPAGLSAARARMALGQTASPARSR